jgi:NADPH-dependent curcumin reductase CurA
MRNVQVRFKRTAPGLPAPDDFEMVETEAPRLTNGGFLSKSRWLAIDPFVRAPAQTARPFEQPQPGDVVPALGVCEVVESRHDVFNVGDHVVLDCGLQTLCVSDGRHAQELHPGQTPASTALGILGPPGMAAYFGLLDMAGLRPGETVLVSAASNAAGSMAGQVAMLKGARAIGIAGSREKCEWVTRHARFSGCINHRAERLSARLKQLAPRGVDVYFDNTGGELLETIVAGHHLAPGGRVILNSLSGRYFAMRSPGGSGYSDEAHGVRFLRINVRDYEHRRGEFLKEAIAWHGADRLVCKEDVVKGLENAVAHLFTALRGENFGRPLVEVLS